MIKARAKSASPTRKKTKSTLRGTTAERRTVKRARFLIERLLQEMESSLSKMNDCNEQEWERLFGTKQSMVANLQKLVAALVALPSYESIPENVQQTMPDEIISGDEIEIFKAWVLEGKQRVSAEAD